VSWMLCGRDQHPMEAVNVVLPGGESPNPGRLSPHSIFSCVVRRSFVAGLLSEIHPKVPLST
jgi:hypothetical protein